MTASLTLTQDVARYTSAALPYLRTHAAMYSQMLLYAEGLTQEMVTRHGDWLLMLEEAGEVCALGIYAGHVPAQFMMLTEWPAQSRSDLVRALAGFPLQRMVAPAATADSVGPQLNLRTPLPRLLSYVLQREGSAPMPAGRAESFTPERIRLLAEWIVAFEHECNYPSRGVDAIVDDLANQRPPLGNRRFGFWVAEGEPVSMVALSLAGDTARIGPVYTPPGARGKGYGSALVAHLSNEALSRGARRVCLFADAANPASNAMYQRIGFVLLGEFAEYGR